MNTNRSEIQPLGRYEATVVNDLIRSAEMYRTSPPAAADRIQESVQEPGRARQALETCLRYFSTYFRE